MQTADALHLRTAVAVSRALRILSDFREGCDAMGGEPTARGARGARGVGVSRLDSGFGTVVLGPRLAQARACRGEGRVEQRAGARSDGHCAALHVFDSALAFRWLTHESRWLAWASASIDSRGLGVASLPPSAAQSATLPRTKLPWQLCPYSYLRSLSRRRTEEKTL